MEYSLHKCTRPTWISINYLLYSYRFFTLIFCIIHDVIFTKSISKSWNSCTKNKDCLVVFIDEIAAWHHLHIKETVMTTPKVLLIYKTILQMVGSFSNDLPALRINCEFSRLNSVLVRDRLSLFDIQFIEPKLLPEFLLLLIFCSSSMARARSLMGLLGNPDLTNNELL